MRIFNIMVGRDLGGLQQAFIDYDVALRMQGHRVINISSAFALEICTVGTITFLTLSNFSQLACERATDLYLLISVMFSFYFFFCIVLYIGFLYEITTVSMMFSKKN